MIGWIDIRLRQVDDGSALRLTTMRRALIEPLREVYGVSDKVLSMAFASVLLADPSVRGVRLRPEGGIELEASDFGRFSVVLPRLARERGIRLHEVSPTERSLEEVFCEMTESS